MEDLRKSPQNLGTVCYCPEWEQTAPQIGTNRGNDGTYVPIQDRTLHFDCPPGVSVTNDNYANPLQRPPSRVGTLERPSSRASGMAFERPPSRTTMTYERSGSRVFDRPNSRMGDQCERPPSCGAQTSTGPIFDNRGPGSMLYERPSSGLERRDGNLSELRASQNMLHCNPNREFDRVTQVHSLCCAEWENGLGPRSEWDIDVDIRQHIQQCTCTCNHMGYGNYMDYQVSLCYQVL